MAAPPSDSPGKTDSARPARPDGDPPPPAAATQDPSLQPGGDPELEFGPRAPTMPQYFLGYALVFGGVIAFALLLVLLMRLLR